MPLSAGPHREPARHARAAVLTALLVLPPTAVLAQPNDTEWNNPPPVAPGFQIVRADRDAVIRFNGFDLKSARIDPARNTIILYFEGEPDRAVFDQLESALPGWIADAYSSSNSAVIRGAFPVTFMTRDEQGGFALRMVPRERTASNGPALRGQYDSGANRAPPDGMQRNNSREAFALRGSYYRGQRGQAVGVALHQKPLSAVQNIEETNAEAPRTGFSVTSHWRQPRHGTIADAGLAASIPVGGGLKLIGSVSETYAKTNNVRRLSGTFAKMEKHTTVAAAGLSFTFGGLTGKAELGGTALWGESGWGGRLFYGERMPHGNWGWAVAYREPYVDTFEAVADHAYRTRARVSFAQRLDHLLWFQAVAHATRYGVRGDDSVARTAGVSASLRYMADLGGVWGGIGYEFNGDYVLDHHNYIGATPTPFTPLSIRTFEVHALSGSLTFHPARGFWLDTYGGYAIDRYGPDGYFGGGDLRYSFAPGWVLSLGGGYSRVSTRQGELGPETSARVKLSYDWGGSDNDQPPKPVSRAYFGDL